jgi:hypothetical protein
MWEGCANYQGAYQETKRFSKAFIEVVSGNFHSYGINSTRKIS